MTAASAFMAATAMNAEQDIMVTMCAGALSSFILDASERQRMMEAVGDACEQQGQLETARELYLAAPNPCAALRIMNRQLSDLIKPAIADEAAGMTPVHATPACTICATQERCIPGA